MEKMSVFYRTNRSTGFRSPLKMLHLNLILLVFLIPNVLGQHRSPPGVNPQQYQQGGNQNAQYQQPPPPQQQQQQQYQRNAPGVPPPQQQQQQQQYQQAPPQQQQQQQFQAPPQQQQQFQAPPQQQQQQQQQQFQAPPQQQPPQPDPQGGGGHNHPQQQRVLHNNNLAGEREHIKDHLEVPLDTSGMSEEELQFHYFKMHDADNNNRLDGQELIKSLFHWHDSTNHEHGSTNNPPPGNKIFLDEELVNMIDPIMDQDDKNRDGFIDYPEFVNAQRKAAASNPDSNSV